MLYTTACLLVSPKQLLPGALQITPTQLHFSGEVHPETAHLSPDKAKASSHRHPKP